jgi:hypothetical protein
VTPLLFILSTGSDPTSVGRRKLKRSTTVPAPFHNRSKTIPPPFHNRSTTVPRPLHNRSTTVPQPFQQPFHQLLERPYSSALLKFADDMGKMSDISVISMGQGQGPKVGRCRVTVSILVLKAPMVSSLETRILHSAFNLCFKI